MENASSTLNLFTVPPNSWSSAGRSADGPEILLGRARRVRTAQRGPSKHPKAFLDVRLGGAPTLPCCPGRVNCRRRCRPSRLDKPTAHEQNQHDIEDPVQPDGESREGPVCWRSSRCAT